MRFARRQLAGALAGVLSVAACQSDRAPTDPSAASIDNQPSLAVSKSTGRKTYIVTTKGDQLPASFDGDVQAQGGNVTAKLPDIGVAVVRSSDAGFRTKAKKIAAVEDVVEDRMVQWVDPKQKVQLLSDNGGQSGGGDGDSPAVRDRFFPIQWAPVAIKAPAAWAQGYTGKGARVAIIDGGIWDQHVDIAPNLDVARSRSFALDANDNPTQFNEDLGTFWHGTHVAGIVAAAANRFGVVGIAPDATIIGVKALHGGSGSFEWLIDAIVYAATPVYQGGAGADIINMSLGALLPRNDPEVVQLIKVLDKATKYAHKRGVTIIASAGNDAINFDVTPDLIDLPAASANVLAISALGPVGYAYGATNFDRQASYTNFGRSLIEFGAPGGDGAYPGNEACTLAINPAPGSTSTTVTAPCWVFDLVVSDCRGSSDRNVCFAAGTSMAAPAASGVAALIIGKNGRMDPDDVEAQLRRSADDLGAPGRDAVYGFGRVNAFRAVQSRSYANNQ